MRMALSLEVQSIFAVVAVTLLVVGLSARSCGSVPL